jgi:hypothetical protein
MTTPTAKQQTSGVSKDSIIGLWNKQQSSAVSILSDAAERWWNRLSSAEKSGVRNYTGSWYIEMNGALRKGQTPSSNVQGMIDGCRSALYSTSSPMDIVVGRGSNVNSLTRMLGSPSGMAEAANSGTLSEYITNKDKIIGTVASDKGFLSTTPVSGGGFGGDVTYRIFVPEGSHGAYVDAYSRHKGEEEFLLQAGSTMRVVDVESKYGSGNAVVVYMEYLK